MFLEVLQIAVFCIALPLVCLVNENIETMRIQVPLHHRLELLFMKSHKLLHGFAELIQTSPRRLANEPGIKPPLPVCSTRLRQGHMRSR